MRKIWYTASHIYILLIKMNSFDWLLEIIKALSSKSHHSSRRSHTISLHVGFAKWFNIRTRWFLRHSFRAYLFLRDDGHLILNGSRMKLFILVSGNERKRDGNRNLIAGRHTSQAVEFFWARSHTRFSRLLYPRSTSFTRCPLMFFAEF